MTEDEGGFLVDTEMVIVYTSRILIMKEHIPFCREFSILSVGYRVASDFEKKTRLLKDSAF